MNAKRLFYMSGLMLFLALTVRFFAARPIPGNRLPQDGGPKPAERFSSKAVPHMPPPSHGMKEIEPAASDDVCRKMDEWLDTGRIREGLLEARRLMKHADPDVRKQVVYAFQWIGDDALPELSSMMNDPDPEVAGIAAEAFWDTLHQVDDADLKSEILEQLLQSADLAIQQRAVDEIGYLPPKRSIPLILEKVPSADPQLYLTIQQNLYFLSGGEEFRTLEEWKAWYAANKEIFESE